ncbi:hypothetical protein K4K57_006746 [Colletotrichum sp. SAR 10_99]|nr:hypothetical protein K4K55_008201 [Colletotrichum sp. SAR 10_96]KAJ5010738.1 hypothetical protein K4K57_006746 [Colletotrichum sp. SAR 10_99]
MPIFQDDFDHPENVTDTPDAEPPQPNAIQCEQPILPSLTRKLSEESIQTELCEGPILESPRPSTPESDAAAVTSDRAELIERLKKGESPTWIPNRHSSSSNLLPPADITPEKLDRSKEEDERLREGLSIQRPRSALHSGDFTEDQPSYGGAAQGRVNAEDGPSPYVGQIDLENGLSNSGEGHRAKRKMQSRVAERRIAEDDVAMGNSSSVADGSDPDARKTQRSRRRSGSPRAPPGGSYRIPGKGQIQIVIKNPNKTAVKLFLVPYDLVGMEPGTKTFIRQRSYSAGPIIENAPGLEDPVGPDKPILRYLVHLHVCCPARGRYYLYKSIRIVFANRVPDGKEKLRNETTCPEPRYTPYKPIRVMHPPMVTSSGPAATLAADKAFRRRSSGIPFGPSMYTLDATDGLSHFPQTMPGQQSSPSPFNFAGSSQPVEPIPFALSGRARLGSDISDGTNASTKTADLRSPQSSQASRPTTKDSWDAQVARYQKLNPGDVGYGGNVFNASGRGSPGGTEGLLSQRLRSLGVQNQGGVPLGNQENQE